MTRHFLTLPAPDLLSLAIAVEASNAWRYREWANRFRPFNEAVSILLDDMAVESDKNGKNLRSSYAERFHDTVRLANPGEIAVHTENASGAGGHFFVVNNTMARSILTSAIHTLSKARSFYKTLFVTTRDAILRKAYEPRASPDKAHAGRLAAFLQRFEESACYS